MLVKQHGKDAPIEAAMRANAMLDKGDLDGFSVSAARFVAKAKPAGTRVSSGATHAQNRPAVPVMATEFLNRGCADASGPAPRSRRDTDPGPNRNVEITRRLQAR